MAVKKKKKSEEGLKKRKMLTLLIGEGIELQANFTVHMSLPST